MDGAFAADDVLSFLDRCLMENPTWSFIDLGLENAINRFVEELDELDDASTAVQKQRSERHPVVWCEQLC